VFNTVKYFSNYNGAFAQWTDLNRSAVMPDTTSSSIDNTDYITTAKTSEIVSATGQMTEMTYMSIIIN